MNSPNLSRDRLLQLIEEAKAKQVQRDIPAQIVPTHALSADQIVEQAIQTSNPDAFEWNADQQRAIDFAVTGKSFCLIGAAGTGRLLLSER